MKTSLFTQCIIKEKQSNQINTLRWDQGNGMRLSDSQSLRRPKVEPRWAKPPTAPPTAPPPTALPSPPPTAPPTPPPPSCATQDYVCLVWCLTSQSTTMVMSLLSVHLTTLFTWASLTRFISTSCFAWKWQQPFLHQRKEGELLRNRFMINLHQSMGPSRDGTRDSWICSRICIIELFGYCKGGTSWSLN